MPPSPPDEIGGPGAAHEARIYWDASTGAVDFSTPLDTVPVNHPTTATRYTWQSGPLTGDRECPFPTDPGPDAEGIGNGRQ